jgi:hypothetical protein
MDWAEAKPANTMPIAKHVTKEERRIEQPPELTAKE